MDSTKKLPPTLLLLPEKFFSRRSIVIVQKFKFEILVDYNVFGFKMAKKVIFGKSLCVCVSVCLSVCEDPLYRSLFLTDFYQTLDLSFFWAY